MRPWLTERGSLTARLVREFGALQVKVVAQGLAPIHHDEAVILGLRPKQLAWVREVLLVAKGDPLVYARSILARTALCSRWHMLGSVGGRPLGAMLFANPAVRRGALHAHRLDARDWRHARAVAVSARPQPAKLWARRSQFTFGGPGLLVCEVFLAGMTQTRK